jgi:hypothetical protein
MHINSTVYYHVPSAAWRTRITIKAHYRSVPFTLSSPAGYSREQAAAKLSGQLRVIADLLREGKGGQDIIEIMGFTQKQRRSDYDPNSTSKTAVLARKKKDYMNPDDVLKDLDDDADWYNRLIEDDVKRKEKV